VKRLLIRPGAIGDCILCFPAMEALRAEYTEVWVPSAVASLVHFADQVRSIASTGLDLFGLPDIEAPPGLENRLREFDEIVSWYGAKRPEFREAIAGLGVPARFLNALPDSPGIHAADFFAMQVGAPVPAVPHIAVPPVPNASFWLHPFSGSKKKNWPYERFELLARRLSAKAPLEWAESHAGHRFPDLNELARHLAGARAYVGNDSGITHLAAATGVPTVALFGSTDPQVWSPRGARVTVLKANDLAGITVDEVLEAVMKLDSSA